LKSGGLRYYDYLVDNQPAEDKMKPETAKQLGTILDGQRKQKHAAATRVAQEQDQEAKNLADFSAKKEQVIKPAFQEIIEMFKARGLPIYMREVDEHKNARGGINSASISVEMYEERPSGSMKPE
jgi:hypothetical protein